MSIPTTGEHRIVIEFNNGEGGGENTQTPSPASPQPITPKQENPIDAKGAVLLSQGINAAKAIGAQGINAAISNIGIATGNYYQQQQAQRAVSGVQQIAGMAMAFTNPFTAVVAVSGAVISTVSEMYQQNKEREIANYSAEQYAKRLGYSKDRR